MMMMRKLAIRIVNAIIKDFTDRRGLRQVWEEIDEDVRLEIKTEWIKIVQEEIEKWEAK